MKINKGQVKITTKTKNWSFEFKRGKGHIFSYLVNRIRWHFYPRINYVSKFPDHIDIEISSEWGSHHWEGDRYLDFGVSILEFHSFTKFIFEELSDLIFEKINLEYSLYFIDFSRSAPLFADPATINLSWLSRLTE